MPWNDRSRRVSKLSFFSNTPVLMYVLDATRRQRDHLRSQVRFWLVRKDQFSHPFFKDSIVSRRQRRSCRRRRAKGVFPARVMCGSPRLSRTPWPKRLRRLAALTLSSVVSALQV
jgi:hypothetical protein